MSGKRVQGQQSPAGDPERWLRQFAYQQWSDAEVKAEVILGVFGLVVLSHTLVEAIG